MTVIGNCTKYLQDRKNLSVQILLLAHKYGVLYLIL